MVDQRRLIGQVQPIRQAGHNANRSNAHSGAVGATEGASVFRSGACEDGSDCAFGRQAEQVK